MSNGLRPPLNSSLLWTSVHLSPNPLAPVRAASVNRSSRSRGIACARLIRLLHASSSFFRFFSFCHLTRWSTEQCVYRRKKRGKRDEGNRPGERFMWGTSKESGRNLEGNRWILSLSWNTDLYIVWRREEKRRILCFGDDESKQDAKSEKVSPLDLEYWFLYTWSRTSKSKKQIRTLPKRYQWKTGHTDL